MVAPSPTTQRAGRAPDYVGVGERSKRPPCLQSWRLQLHQPEQQDLFFLDRNTHRQRRDLRACAGRFDSGDHRIPSRYYLDTGTVTSPDAAVYLRMEDSFGRVVQISDNSTAATVGDRRPYSVELPDSNDYDYKLLFENFTTPVGWFPYRRTYDT
jgi:hypothetical protein